MPLLSWMPEQAGGVNLYEDTSSLPEGQLATCNNYYPHARRWRLIQGNGGHTASAVSDRIRHLVEYQSDDGSLGTNKNLLAMRDNGNIYEISSGGWTQLTGPATSTSATLKWDTTNFTGILLMANGTDNLLETLNASTYAATAGSPPAGPAFVEAWKNRVFIGGRKAAPLTVNYSADSDRTIWTGADSSFETITSPVGDFLTGIRSVENYLAMFTRRTLTVLIGDDPDNWVKRTLFEDHGCSTARTIAKVNGGLVYANDAGVWFLNADLRRTELSRDIRPYWQNLGNTSTQRNKARSAFMHAVYDPTPDMNRYYIWVAEGSSTAEDVCWIFHFNSGQWSKMVSFMDSGQTCQASCLREDASGNIQTYFGAGSNDSSTTDKKVYKIDSSAAFSSLTGGNIAATLTSGIFGGIFRAFPQQTGGIITMKNWKNFFGKFTATTAASTNVTVAVAAHDSNSKVTQASRTQSITSSSADFVRARIPLVVNGWGIQLTVSRTGQVDHSFLGGVFEYTEDAGTM